ncbi:hypothetical protein U9M48_040744 [Paspalum notatum var. saurae]|uniref:Uncharacterized protein n=1 Tax=Paspalum notatum var. saurae TaxID=547442 RepID=A0AAQ3XE36_PASNO
MATCLLPHKSSTPHPQDLGPRVEKKSPFRSRHFRPAAASRPGSSPPCHHAPAGSTSAAPPGPPARPPPRQQAPPAGPAPSRRMACLQVPAALSRRVACLKVPVLSRRAASRSGYQSPNEHEAPSTPVSSASVTAPRPARLCLKVAGVNFGEERTKG